MPIEREETLDPREWDPLRSLGHRIAALPSHTRIGDRSAIRACITNHRTRRVDLAIDSVLLIERAAGAEAAAFQKEKV